MSRVDRSSAVSKLRPLVVRLSAIALAAVACAGPPPPPTGDASQRIAGFHEDFDAFLRRHVRGAGRIDYAAARGDAADLDRYVERIRRVSPESDPAAFPTRADRLAYWLNAYNAWVIALVLDHYPIESVRDVRPPLFFLPRLSGFFVFSPIELGGRKTNLRDLENGLIRRRFGDPRVHFALNCASGSCPRLPRRAFTPEGLEAELVRETRLFLSEPRNLRIEPAPDGGRILLSSIFDWYERDFTDHAEQQQPGEPATLQAYLALELPAAGSEAEALRRCGDCRIEFEPYDWRLNDTSR